MPFGLRELAYGMYGTGTAQCYLAVGEEESFGSGCGQTVRGGGEQGNRHPINQRMAVILLVIINASYN